MELADVKTYRSRVILYSISAGAFRKRCKWNSLFAFAFLAATRYLHRLCRARLPPLRRL